MGKGSNINSNTDIEHFTYDAFSDACKNGEKLIIVNGNVYNVANWMKKHPGGGKIIGHFIGQDATVKYFGCFHSYAAFLPAVNTSSQPVNLSRTV